MSLNPLPLLSSLATTAGSFLGGIQTYLIVGAVVGLLGAAGGTWLGYHIEYGALQAQLAADAKAQTQAVNEARADEKAQAAVNVKAAQAWQAQYDKDNLQPKIITQEITRYVTLQADAVTCVPVGLARLMRAAANHEADPATVQLAPGQSDDECSDVSASEMAGWFEDFAGKAFSNADQLDALQAWIKDNHAAQVSASVSP